MGSFEMCFVALYALAVYVCVCARAHVLLLLSPKLIAFLDHMTTVGIAGKFHGL